MNAEFQAAFDSWLVGAQEKINQYWEAMKFTYGPPETLKYKIGKRYVLVTRHSQSPGGSAHAFIDLTNGDVLKPATYKAPAKHARGNIFDASNGLASMGPHGPAYL